MPSCDGLEGEILMSLVIGKELDPPKIERLFSKRKVWDDVIPFQKTGDVKGSICEFSRVYCGHFENSFKTMAKKQTGSKYYFGEKPKVDIDMHALHSTWRKTSDLLDSPRRSQDDV